MKLARVTHLDPLIPKASIRHILKRHRDWITMLNLSTESDVEKFLQHALENPTEVYRDRFRDNVKYYLMKLNSYYLCIVVVRNIVVTAYLINREKYEKYKVRRWVR
jgi:hypothetical protein